MCSIETAGRIELAFDVEATVGLSCIATDHVSEKLMRSVVSVCPYVCFHSVC